MKFLHCSTIYNIFLQQVFQGLHPESMTYNMLVDKIVSTRFGWSDYWITSMKSLGWEGMLIIGNSDIVQKAWLVENGRNHERFLSLKSIVIEQIREFRPDIVFLEDLYFYDHEFRREARNISPPPRIIGWRFAPHRATDCFDLLDGLITGAKPFVDEFRHLGIPCEVVPLAFDSSLLKEVKILHRDVPISFAGHVGGRSGVHRNRYALILSLLKHTGIQIWGLWVPEPNPLNLLHIVKWLRQHREISFMSKRIYPPVFGLNYFELLARSQIVFNAHIDVATNFAGNMRMFEASGMGACLVTDWKSNIADFFEPEVDLVCYKTNEQAMEQITYLVEHPEEARRIAERGQRRTLMEHTYEKRAPILDDFFKKILHN
jgi:spore maturation protein CgeB